MTDTDPTLRPIKAGKMSPMDPRIVLQGGIAERLSHSLWFRSSHPGSYGFRMFHEAWRGGPVFTNLERPGMLNHEYHVFIAKSISAYLFSRVGYFPHHTPQMTVSFNINHKRYIQHSIPLMDVVLELTPWDGEKRLSWSETFDPTLVIKGTDTFEAFIGGVDPTDQANHPLDAAVVLRGDLLRPLQ